MRCCQVFIVVRAPPPEGLTQGNNRDFRKMLNGNKMKHKKCPEHPQNKYNFIGMLIFKHDWGVRRFVIGYNFIGNPCVITEKEATRRDCVCSVSSIFATI